MYETWHFFNMRKVSLFPTGENERNEERNKIEDPMFYRKQLPEVFCKKDFLRNLTKFIGKHLFQSLSFNKVVGLKSYTLLKKRLCTGVFLWILQNLSERLFLQNSSGGCFCFVILKKAIQITRTFLKSSNWNKSEERPKLTVIRILIGD